jgi:hypothetical protein
MQVAGAMNDFDASVHAWVKGSPNYPFSITKIIPGIPVDFGAVFLNEINPESHQKICRGSS